MPELRGPRGPIRYERDDLGYPSIEARDLEEASWARGWFHAHDRLVQVQLMLAIAHGRALELMGDTPVARYVDRMTRLHRFTGDLDEQVAKLDPQLVPIIDAYGAGFDAGARARGWPLLLRAIGIRPRPYRARDMIAIYRVVLWFGLNQLVEMASLITGELIAGKASPRALALLLGDAATRDELSNAPAASWPAELSAMTAPAIGGSNAIAIAGTRSASGGALLVADPHLEIGRIPPVLYATHATHGSEYMQGLHIPGFWVASFGRTAHVGWTYTYGHVQSVDVHVARCRRGEYHDGASWRPLVRRDAQVAIKKRPKQTWTFWDCDLGTVVGDANGDEIALPCIRWSGIRETYKDLNAGLALVRAKNLDEAMAQGRNTSLFCLDAILADSSGRIGHVLGGRMDARPAGSGGVVPRVPNGAPAPFDEATRPATIDPPSGWIVSANARPSEPGGAAWVPMPESSARRDRLAELVAATPRPTLDDLCRFVRDACDASARRLLAVWDPLLPDHARAKTLVAWAAQQPGSDDEHFAQLALWTALHERVCRLLIDELLGGERGRRLVDDALGLLLFRHHLDEALALARPDVLDRDQLRALLAKAFPLALASHGKLPRRRRFKNAVFAGKLPWLFDSKPIELLGAPTTPNQITAIALGGQDLVFGPAGRYVCDMSKPGGSYCLSGGASERRVGIGYAAGLEDWARGRFRPLGACRSE